MCVLSWMEVSLHVLSAHGGGGAVGGVMLVEKQTVKNKMRFQVSVSFVCLMVLRATNPRSLQVFGVKTQLGLFISEILPGVVDAADVGACGRSVVPLCVCVSCAVGVQVLYDCTSHTHPVCLS